jgi:hypothetical protein
MRAYDSRGIAYPCRSGVRQEDLVGLSDVCKEVHEVSEFGGWQVIRHEVGGIGGDDPECYEVISCPADQARKSSYQLVK